MTMAILGGFESLCPEDVAAAQEHFAALLAAAEAAERRGDVATAAQLLAQAMEAEVVAAMTAAAYEATRTLTISHSAR